MLRSVKELAGLKILASDGEIGEVYEFYFDDVNWTIRYLVVRTGNWLNDKQVLISPAAVGKPDWDQNRLTVNLTKKQIQDSPDISTDKPVSRQSEMELLSYYNWPVYWDFDMGGMPYTSSAAYVASNPEDAFQKNKPVNKERRGDPHLRSSREVIGYKVQATDDEVGYVKDFIVDDGSWIIRYFVVDTGNRIISGRKVILSPHWIEDINWNESKVQAVLSVDSIKRSPEYNPSETLGREYEEVLYQHYGLPKYWI